MLLVHAAAFVVGVVFAASSGATSLSFVALAGPLLLVATYGAWRRRLVVGLLGPLGLVWLAAGVLSWQSTQSRPASACKLERYLGQFRARRLAVELRSPLRSSPQGGWQFARALWVQQGKAVYPACGRIIVYHARQAGNEHLSSGRRFLLHGTLRAVSPAPRQAGCNRLGYPTTDARFYVRPGGAVPLDPVRVGLLDSLRERLRREIASACGASSHTGAVLRALVLGERSGLVSDRRRIYATAGLSHLLAVSGLHLSLVAGLLFALTRAALQRSYWVAARWHPDAWASLVAIAAAIGYSTLTGWAPSTGRACVMACAIFVARLVGRPPDFIRPLALACVLLLVVNPRQLFLPGFQLSFMAVVGIALATRHPLARRWVPTLALGRALLALGVVSLGASLATAPLVLYHFGRVSLIGLALNLIAVPWVTYLLLPAALLGSLMSLIVPQWGVALLRAAGRLAQVLDATARWAAELPFSAIDLPVDALGVVGAVVLVAALLVARGRWRSVAVCGALLLTGDLIAGVGCGGPQPGVKLSFIDVGQGDSILVRFGDGATMLVDAGGSGWSGYDPGEQRVVPYLESLGVRELDYLVISHPDADHVGGARAVLGAFPVGEVWLCWHAGHNEWVERLRRWADSRAVPVRVPRSVRHGGATVRQLWPPAGRPSCADPLSSTNDNSIVLQVKDAAGAVLLSGDIERDVEARLVSRGELSRVTLLKVPHHGSNTSSTEQLLRRLRPSLAVVSCGSFNRFGFPHRAVVQRYRRLGIPLVRTDQLGTVSVRLGDEAVLLSR
jgi:competence protein ComEC